MTTLLELEKERLKLEASSKTLKAEFEKAYATVRTNLMMVNRQIDLSSNSLDLEKVKIAEAILTVGGQFLSQGDSRSVILDAIEEFAGNRGIKFKERYFGVKNYEGFYRQRCDCRYGMGPRHGYIVFSVGLDQEVRERDLTDEEIDAVIYYLRNIETIQKATNKEAAQK